MVTKQELPIGTEEAAVEKPKQEQIERIKFFQELEDRVSEKLKDVKTPGLKLPLGTLDIIKLDMANGLTKEAAIQKYIEKNNAQDLGDQIREELKDLKDFKLEDFFEYPENLKGFIPKRMADAIKKKFIFKTPMDTEEVYVYQDGVYKPNAEPIIKSLVRDYLEEKQRVNHVTETTAAIAETTYIERNELPINLLNLKNGIFDLDTKKLIPHDPEIFTVTQLPIEYNKKIKCPKIKKFLSEILIKDDIPIIQELFGYCLYRKYILRKAFFFIGSGFNGKSTLVKLFERFLGNDNVSSVSLQDIEIKRFSKAELYGKLANTYSDVSSYALTNTGNFKMLTGNDLISAEKKFKQKLLNFTNYAKFIFSMNQLPATRDNTDAFFDRIVFIKFLNEFRGEKEDPQILEKITDPGELSGLFNWAIEGLERLFKNNSFSRSKTTEETRDQYIRLSDPMAAFVLDKVEQDYQNYVTKENLYNAFVEYCKESKLPLDGKTMFGKKLPQYIKVTETHPEINGRRARAWQGIKLKGQETKQKRLK